MLRVAVTFNKADYTISPIALIKACEEYVPSIMDYDVGPGQPASLVSVEEGWTSNDVAVAVHIIGHDRDAPHKNYEWASQRIRTVLEATFNRNFAVTAQINGVFYWAAGKSTGERDPAASPRSVDFRQS